MQEMRVISRSMRTVIDAWDVTMSFKAPAAFQESMSIEM